jgi:hypothetical protein
MAGEAKMNTNGRVRDEEPNVTGSFSGLAHDAIELAELQAQLFTLDVKSATQRTRTSIMLSIIGVCMLLGSIPVALHTLAELLVEQAGWSQTAGFAVATLVGIGLSLGFLAVAWTRFRTGLNAMQRSREELNRNIAWIKSNLRNRAAAENARERARESESPRSPR